MDGSVTGDFLSSKVRGHTTPFQSTRSQHAEILDFLLIDYET